MFGFTVRHNPSQQIYVWVYSATHPGLRPPLSERGWRGSDLLIIKTMRQPIPSRRGVHGVRGVSHHQTPSIPGCVALSSIYIPRGSHHQTSSICGVSHCQIGYPMDPVNPWSCYRVAALKILRKSNQKLFKYVLSVGICLDSQRGGDDGMIRTSRQKINIILFKTQ